LKTGVFRAKFLLESVANLQKNLNSRNHDLLIHSGTPESILPSLVQEYNVSTIYAHEGEATEEQLLLSSIETAVTKLNCTVQKVWGNTLYHIDDLPFNPRQVGAFPPTASNFRNKTEKKSEIRPAFPIPSKLKRAPEKVATTATTATTTTTGTTATTHNTLPTLADLVGESIAGAYQQDPRSTLEFVGGEDAALSRMQEYFFDKDCLKDYFHTRNGMLGPNYSSKFSPWLSLGCLSPRLIYEEVCRYEKQRVKNKDTYWMLFELNVRDYFRFYTLHWGSSVFHLHGPKRIVQQNKNKGNNSSNSNNSNSSNKWTQDLALFERWKHGTTGNPMIDANMRELLSTGFMSNRGRQIVASYLTRDLGLDWRLGAMHFESFLIDHDPCSNWGNWTYAAGVGSDPREDRYFNIAKQTKNYDPDHNYIRHWVEEMNVLSQQQLMKQLTRGCRAKSSYNDGKGSNKGGHKGGNKGGKSGRKDGRKNKQGRYSYHN
jgi:deoxyribodipyrimidine photo-lyase